MMLDSRTMIMVLSLKNILFVPWAILMFTIFFPSPYKPIGIQMHETLTVYLTVILLCRFKWVAKKMEKLK